MNTLSSLFLSAALALRAEPLLEAVAPVEPGLPVTPLVDIAAPPSGPAAAVAVEPTAGDGASVSPPTPEPIPVRVEIDLSAIPEADTPFLERAVRPEVDRLLASKGFVAAADADRSLVIRISSIDADRGDFGIDIELRAFDRRIEPTLGQITCPICPDIMVVEALVEHLPAALDALARAPMAAPIEPAPAAPKEPPSTPSTPTLMEPAGPMVRPPRPVELRKARELGAVGILGTTVGLGGLGVMAYGCWEVSKGQPHENDDRVRRGWILYGVGLGITAVGIVMITVDVSALYERRARRVAVAPVVDATHVGLRLRGRF